MTDKQLIDKISSNPEAFGEIIDGYEDKLMRYILRISDINYEDAENLLQEIFIKIYRYIHEYDERYSLSSWIFRIAHNMVIGNPQEKIRITGVSSGSTIFTAERIMPRFGRGMMNGGGMMGGGYGQGRGGMMNFIDGDENGYGRGKGGGRGMMR